jgi:hypothetical protein
LRGRIKREIIVGRASAQTEVDAAFEAGVCAGKFLKAAKPGGLPILALADEVIG